MSLGGITSASGSVTSALEQISQIEQQLQVNNGALLSSLTRAGSTSTSTSTASTDTASSSSDSADALAQAQGTSDGRDLDSIYGKQ
jgi:hypothetical protein